MRRAVSKASSLRKGSVKFLPHKPDPSEGQRGKAGGGPRAGGQLPSLDRRCGRSLVAGLAPGKRAGSSASLPQRTSTATCAQRKDPAKEKFEKASSARFGDAFLEPRPWSDPPSGGRPACP
ncbi:Hypothetical predicted protein [Podarcis lilfordi]|uniref:Uncharacterized protein n=1 Tax=Podarcis lilfordi TaxID=74358 RepID=A0AA35PRT1_9SAUR|nr:Hypothetical predicted protein [Podarcis lilfordi]